MPTVLRIGPYRFYFYSRENNEPAHIHVDSNGRDAKVWLANLDFAYNYGFSAKELTQILGLVKEHQALFMEAWNEHFSDKA